ncbi:Outer membrane protein assembly factor BamE [uncultured bacterium]|nr:Outer membrane protein assembly factor BamE [uncultured bacterium]
MKKSLFFVTCLTLSACSTVLNNLPGVYTLEIQQGNIVDQDMINQLRPNMDKRQVLYIMGSPMLTDFFHKNRWDYIYSVRPSGEDQVQKRVSLVFKGEEGFEKLAGLYGDFKPTNLPVEKPPTEQTIDLPKREVDRTMWEVISGLFYDEADSDTEASKTDKTKKENDDSSILPF